MPIGTPGIEKIEREKGLAKMNRFRIGLVNDIRHPKRRRFAGIVSGLAAVIIALAALRAPVDSALAQKASGTDVIIRLRLSGDSAVLAPIRSCLADRLSQMPDVKVATSPIAGARFIVDVMATKDIGEGVSASLVVAQTFPMDEFRPRIKEGEDAKALLDSIRYYTLLRLHEFIPGQSNDALCARITADIGEKVLSKEYTERDD
jgi:hypothetical protein